jgi:acyl-CoA-binding protein
LFDLKGKYKWEAWSGNKGKSKQAAQQEYVDFVHQLQAKQ